MNQADNKTICERLFFDFRGILTWKWDDWVGAFLAEISTDKELEARTILEKHLPVLWDSSNINKAPKVVQDLANYLGGIKPAQYLFCSDPSSEAFVFCAWWPWGNGITISLRIAPYDTNLSKSVENELKRQLMELVGL